MINVAEWSKGRGAPLTIIRCCSRSSPEGAVKQEDIQPAVKGRQVPKSFRNLTKCQGKRYSLAKLKASRYLRNVRSRLGHVGMSTIERWRQRSAEGPWFR